jgi:hypothetical protein
MWMPGFSQPTKHRLCAVRRADDNICIVNRRAGAARRLDRRSKLLRHIQREGGAALFIAAEDPHHLELSNSRGRHKLRSSLPTAAEDAGDLCIGSAHLADGDPPYGAGADFAEQCSNDHSLQFAGPCRPHRDELLVLRPAERRRREIRQAAPRRLCRQR